MIPLKDVQAARQRIRDHVQVTPVVKSRVLGRELGVEVFLKLEMLQRCGMFKVRGAFNALLGLDASERERGVVAVSGGNHGIAVANAAKALGLRAVVVMPQSTPANYVEAAESDGAEVVLTPTVHDAFAEAERRRASGMVFVHPFDNPRVIAGQGTLGLELLEQVPDLTDVIVSIGGGGLMSGVASALKAVRPEVRLWGVETEGADAMHQALEAGRPVTLSAITSVAKTLGAPSVSEFTLAIAQRHLERVVVVPDAEAVRELVVLLEVAKVLCEPAASCTLAAARQLRSSFAPDARVALILCGGNVTFETVTAWRRDFAV